jgi:hypothetical protein
MRDPARIEPMLNRIRILWELYPDWRLGQLLVNIVRPKRSCPEVFYIEDDELIRRLETAFGIYLR